MRDFVQTLVTKLAESNNYFKNSINGAGIGRMGEGCLVPNVRTQVFDDGAKRPVIV